LWSLCSQNLDILSSVSLSYTRLIAWQGQLVKELGRAEALSAEVMQLSAQLEQVKQAYDGLARL
jgi:hypothetical protein